MLSISSEKLKHLNQQISFDLFMDAKEELCEELAVNNQLEDIREIESLYGNTAKFAVSHGFSKVHSLNQLLIHRLNYGDVAYDRAELSQVLTNPYMSEGTKIFVMDILAEKQLEKQQNSQTSHMDSPDSDIHSPFDDIVLYSLGQRVIDMQALESKIQHYPPNHPIVRQRLLHHQGYYLAILRQLLTHQVVEMQWQGKEIDLSTGCCIHISTLSGNKQLSFVSTPRQEALTIRLNNIGEHLVISVPADHIIDYYVVLVELVKAYCVLQQSTAEIKTIRLEPEAYKAEANEDMPDGEQTIIKEEVEYA